ncbi:hypothetical protein ACX93W_26740 [Paenibacillus sp. CAU 1782]
MKKSEIEVGGVYGNGKGRIRKVIAEGAEFVLYPGQGESDNLRFEVVNDGSKKNRTKGSQGNITRTAFAAWAKERISASLGKEMDANKLPEDQRNEG